MLVVVTAAVLFVDVVLAGCVVDVGVVVLGSSSSLDINDPNNRTSAVAPTIIAIAFLLIFFPDEFCFFMSISLPHPIQPHRLNHELLINLEVLRQVMNSFI